MPETISADGSRIGYERIGDGPAVILMGGAFNDRDSVRGVGDMLALAGFAAVVFDRRGRGASTEAGPWSVDREVEDVAALIADPGAGGGSAALFGHSSGAGLALHAARALPEATSVAVYEVPYRAEPMPDDTPERVAAALDAGDADAATRAFLTGAVGVPAPVVDGMAVGPGWAAMTAMAHTLPYELALSATGEGIPAFLDEVRQPALVLTGGESAPWWRDAAERIAARMPDARTEVVPGQDHAVLAHPEALREPLTRFFAA
ncbi:alpha/beta fold hydrolase [Agromyces archimandritae]|uniref:Alpha/beta hydrolase n=1 Tax=Agromyces archimandritae TaxID=2781962 RepID=A0A975FNM5_9MICO|nr:alpha/beta hydrolase [Agromyces archimandritae]QTX05778.1 alpha/beta hydrolase [Agromyces archimandritae]